MATNAGSASLFESNGTQSRIRAVGGIAMIIIAIWASAAPALASSPGPRQKANKAASMIHKVRVADLASEAWCYVLPLVLGTGF